MHIEIGKLRTEMQVEFGKMREDMQKNRNDDDEMDGRGTDQYVSCFSGLLYFVTNSVKAAAHEQSAGVPPSVSAPAPSAPAQNRTR